MIPTTNTDIFLGLLIILLSIWMILWSMQSTPTVQKWAKIIGGLIIAKVTVLLVMQLFCGACKHGGCSLKHKGMQGMPVHQNQNMAPPAPPTTGN